MSREFPKIGLGSISGQLTVTSGKRQEMSSVWAGLLLTLFAAILPYKAHFCNHQERRYLIVIDRRETKAAGHQGSHCQQSSMEHDRYIAYPNQI